MRPIPKLSRTVEQLVVREAKALNKELILEYAKVYNDISFPLFLREMNMKLQQAALDSIILGYALGQKVLNKNLNLSLRPRINRLISPEELSTLEREYEFEAAKWSRFLRRDLSQIMIDWSNFAQREGYTPEEAGKAMGTVFKSRGYGATTARNIRNTLTTGLHLGYNGVLWVETSHNPDVWGYRYHTAGDELVRDNHVANQGVTLPKEHPFWLYWWPPNGYNCRCRPEMLLEEENIVEPDPIAVPDPGFSGNPFTAHVG